MSHYHHHHGRHDGSMYHSQYHQIPNQENIAPQSNNNNQQQLHPILEQQQPVVVVDNYHSHPPHSHSHIPLVSVPTYCSHNGHSMNNEAIYHYHPHHQTHDLINHHNTNNSNNTTNNLNLNLNNNTNNLNNNILIDESSPHIVNNNIPSFNCSSCPTTTSSNLAFHHHSHMNNNNSTSNNNTVSSNSNNKKRKLSMTDIESANSSCTTTSNTTSMITTSSSYELESIPTRLFMGECIRVKIREIPGIMDQFRQMFEQHEVSLQNLTVCFQKEGLFNFQLPCFLEGNDCIVFSVPKREVFLPYFQNWEGSMTLHHCAVTISARSPVPNGGDCIMILMHQSCCSIVCLETSDMLNFVSKCFSEPKRLKHLLLTVKERYTDEFGAMLHTEDECPLTEPMRSNLKIVKELGKGSNGFVYLVEKRKSATTDLWKNSKKLALKQSFSSNPTRVQDYIAVHKAMKDLSRGETESNVIQIYEIQSVTVEESNTHISEILMEKCEYDLGRYCRRYFKSCLTVETLKSLIHILNQTVNGIRMIHNSGYCHLDIKEGNIMLNREKIVKIIDFDFSIAKNVPISSKRGTPLYLINIDESIGKFSKRNAAS
ncbi:protein kinase [Naegleria gruberi]|uniref:Protein kinase n=1 Tax=Naegleria gruberi TaxID=5762 RepID=D2V4I3_NAEGR|nr:protein kinase [Naegleria gruberi]EFC48389.1 protein kinase [Naegleria gruberi]|eukprot:XP_002681133.1 protein kinase [Naegleria gruberi]